MKTTIDGAGRIVVPKSLRDQLHLKPGAELEIDVLDDSVVIRHCETHEPLVEKRGILVHHGPKPADLDVVSFIREQRSGRAVGQIRGARRR